MVDLIQAANKLEQQVRSLATGVECDVSLGSYEGEPSFYIAWLYIPEGDRSSGIGTRIMKVLCEYSDKLGVSLTLTPAKKNRYTGTTSRDRLVDFYQRFGFKVSNSAFLMYRYPEK